ncbi:Cell division cycle protein 123 [Taphrina deformans PYCC 5710]|uniref:Cell division cycle protein 123 n=1 Tax=Taphrina deformans (strain PYCC 5710 / ATCC 11124 / CBS 356.35 / IMI 108563 / JCM 9778 / NBRC 8474) TaxID=1097556 RepID=R4XBZ7_TAPDE|nr:Cell division cycle protein 123 [Taphrina deformans PYCC 5710]|eukprot:CCG80865.1 Cell division cycle protein 123 [Taphrina deformans PYCC 5710]
MYATKNADKDSKGPDENRTRIALMQAFSKKVSEYCNTHICLTKHPYFVDKFHAVREEVPAAKQIYIVGYDTFVRILDKKYYPDQDLSKSGLEDFFAHGKLLCAMREDDKWGNSATQREHVERLAAGQVDGVPAHWGENIALLTLKEDDALGVSSSMIRQAATASDEATLAKYLTPEVRQVIREEGLYGATDTNEIKFPYLTRAHVMNCSFSRWHGKYKHISPRARVIKPLPAAFIQYLNEDGLMLPQDSRTMKRFEALSSDSEASDFEDEGFEEEDPTDAFRELHDTIEREIRALGGAVVPKLNWSTPKDALWITADKTLKCTSPDDIYLLLKSSDFIVHDLDHAFDDCVDGAAEALAPPEVELVLKKWFNAQPSMEFRCFVGARRLVAVSQRDVNHYDFLEAEGGTLLRLAQDLYGRHLATFPDPNFVFDMYVSLEQDRAWLMDINPFSPTTDAKLFTWREILDRPAHEAPELRLVAKGTVMTGGPEYTAHRVPLELVESSDGVDPITFAETFQRKLATAVFDA